MILMRETKIRDYDRLSKFSDADSSKMLHETGNHTLRKRKYTEVF